MTDARLRGEWLNSMRFESLSDVTWRVLTGALMWSAENGTDGHVPERFLKRLHPDGEHTEAFDELLSVGLWQRSADGFILTDWDGVLGQSPALTVETYKANGRKRQRSFREKTRRNLAASIGFEPESSAPVTRDVTSSITRDVGIGKGKGEGRDLEALTNSDFVNQSMGEVTDGHDWPTVSILNSDPRCGVCQSALLSPVSKLSGVCGKTDSAHRSARAAA